MVWGWSFTTTPHTRRPVSTTRPKNSIPPPRTFLLRISPEYAWIKIGLHPKYSQNHILSPAVLFCPLHSKIAEFERISTWHHFFSNWAGGTCTGNFFLFGWKLHMKFGQETLCSNKIFVRGPSQLNVPVMFSRTPYPQTTNKPVESPPGFPRRGRRERADWPAPSSSSASAQVTTLQLPVPVSNTSGVEVHHFLWKNKSAYQRQGRTVHSQYPLIMFSCRFQ